jgi:hypothetical protein
MSVYTADGGDQDESGAKRQRLNPPGEGVEQASSAGQGQPPGADGKGGDKGGDKEDEGQVRGTVYVRRQHALYYVC